MAKKQKKLDILDVNANVGIAFGLSMITLLLTLIVFYLFSK
jgi:hypothetical protein